MIILNYITICDFYINQSNDLRKFNQSKQLQNESNNIYINSEILAQRKRILDFFENSFQKYQHIFFSRSHFIIKFSNHTTIPNHLIANDLN